MYNIYTKRTEIITCTVCLIKIQTLKNRHTEFELHRIASWCLFYAEKYQGNRTFFIGANSILLNV